MFSFSLFLVYSCPIFDIVMIRMKFMHMFVKCLVQLRVELGGRSNVGMVSRLYLPADAPYFLGHVVDHEGGLYSFVESSIVDSMNLGHVQPSCLGMNCSILEFPEVMFLMIKWKIDYAINDKE